MKEGSLQMNIKKYSFPLFLLSWLLAAAITYILNICGVLYNVGTVLYTTLLLSWALSVRQRVTRKNIRRWLLVVAALLMGLFFFRLVRYNFTQEIGVISRYAWYVYYIPFTAIPISAYLVSVCIGRVEEDGLWPKAKLLILLEGVLSLFLLTNDFHGWLFHITDKKGGEFEYMYGWLYIVVILWGLGFTVAAFVQMIKNCSISAAKHRWYVPLVPSVAGMILLVWYYAYGGSPEWFGVNLYNLQEVFSFTFLSLFEGSIRIGLIPSTSGYDELFSLSHVNAVIKNADGRLVYQSSQEKQDMPDRLVRLRTRPISGGEVTWAEDLTNIRSLNERIRMATEQIEEENDLIEQENRVRAERIGYEIKNALYDRIAEAVRPQVQAIEEQIFENQNCSEEQFRDKLCQAAVMGAYVKRRGNLMLLEGEHPFISSEELTLSIRESFEYLALSGVYTKVFERSRKVHPAALLLMAYDLFEEVLEAVYAQVEAYVAYVDAEPNFKLELAVAAAQLPIRADWHKEELSKRHMALSIRHEDDTFYVKLFQEAG